MQDGFKVTKIPASRRSPYLTRVGIYARVSTARVEQLRSLSAQVSGLTRHVYNRYDWVLKDVYIDVCSAKTGSARPEFARMISDCKNHQLDVVITKSLSRFGRDSEEIIESVRAIVSAGGKIYFMDEDRMVDQDYPELEISISAAISQSENEHRSENIKMGLKYRAESGSLGLYKKPCYGYVKGEDGELVPNEAQAAIVVHIYDLYLSGKSFAGIIEELASEEIPSPQGSERWSKKMIENVLTNLKYTGNVEVLKTKTGRNSYLMKNSHEAIIPWETFMTVQEEMAKRTKRPRQYERMNIEFIEDIIWDATKQE